LTTDLWTDAATIRKEAGRPDVDNFGFPPDVPAGEDTDASSELNDYIETVMLPAVQSMINRELHQSFTSSTVDPAIVYTAIRICARALNTISVNKKGGVTTANGMIQSLADPTVFTPELKAEIAGFRRSTPPMFYQQQNE